MRRPQPHPSRIRDEVAEIEWWQYVVSLEPVADLGGRVPPPRYLSVLDIEARDVCHRHFSATAHRGEARWRPVNRGPAKERHHPLFRFVHRRQHALKVVLYRSHVRDARAVTTSRALGLARDPLPAT